MKVSALLLSTAALVSADYGCTEGAMTCSGTGFVTCNFNNWVYRECGPGTACFMVADNHPTCGWPKNNYTPKSYPQTPVYPQTPAYPPKEYEPEPPKEYKSEPPKDYKPEPSKEYKPETPKCEKMYGLCLCSDSYSAGYVKGSDCLEYGWENNASCIKKGGKKCDKPAYKPEPYKQAPPPEYKPYQQAPPPPEYKPYQQAPPPQEYKPYQQAPPPQEYKPEPPKSYSSLSYVPPSPSYGGQQQSYVCTQGAMMCQGTGFTTCDHNNWVYRPCGPGTECFMVAENHPTCGWPRNKYQPQQPGYGQEQHYGGY